MRFARFDEKRKSFGYFEKVFEGFQVFSSENCLKCSILTDFSKNVTNHESIFARLDDKHNLFGIFERIFKGFLNKIAKMIYFSKFFKNN